MKTKILEIDRSRPLNFSNMGSPTGHADFKIVEEDSRSLAITQLDMSRVRLEAILEVTEKAPKNLNERRRDALKKLKDQGFVFLDAKIVETLLLNPQFFPSDWFDIADSDSINDRSGSIRFDGTVFEIAGSGRRFVLSPFVARGQWGFGFTDLDFSKQDLDVYQGVEDTVHLRSYTVVLAP